MSSRQHLPFEIGVLHSPPLEEITKVLQQGLSQVFAEVEVAVVDCPDLTQKPFMLADKGLTGSPCLADIGGVPYLLPLAQLEKKYDLTHIPGIEDIPGAFMVGAGAGPAHLEGTNCEKSQTRILNSEIGSLITYLTIQNHFISMITNIKAGLEGRDIINKTHICKLNPKDNSYILKQISAAECCLLMNLYVSEGKPGKVLRVKVRGKTGPCTYINYLREVLEKHYGDKLVGLGGVFVMESGKAKIHVMPDFSKVPLTCDEEVDTWLKFFEVPAPLVCLGYVVSSDPGLDLRMDHFHCFSDHGVGGHFHYTTTPEDVQYTSYFNVAQHLYRVDRPQVTHQYGRN